MQAPSFADLSREVLRSAGGLEVVTSLVDLPPHFQLPAHTHPGEEFAYVVEGTLYYLEEGQEELTIPAGTSANVPLNKVHSVRTGEEAAKLVVFRVHEAGQPDRTLVDQQTA